MNIPEELRYTKDHEWAKVEDGFILLGITDYAQHELGDIVFVDLKPGGTTIKKGESVGTLESVKAVSDVYSPVTGTIAEVNLDLETSPELVNQDCYGKGWMVRLEITAPDELSSLMDPSAYREYLAQEAK
jgi:glycine cleavage system H protein